MRSQPPGGFTEFVLARGPALHRTATLLTGNQASAEDLVQTALLKTWRGWGRVQDEHEAHVRRILVNEFATRRTGRPRGDGHPTDPLRRATGPDQGDSDALHHSLVSTLAELPARRRAIVVLRYFHGYTEAMAAEALGISTGTVRSQTSKALSTLKVDHRSDAGPAGGAAPHLTRAAPAMSATLDDLRTALWNAAERVAVPAATDTLAGMQRRTAARMRRRGLAVATLVAGALVAGLLVTQGARRAAAPPSTPPQPALRAVADDPYFPVQAAGRRRVSLGEWTMAPGVPVALRYPPAPVGATYLVAYCSHTHGTVPVLLVQHGDLTDDLPCLAKDGPSGPQRVTLTARQGRVSLEARGANAVGTARVAIYQRVPPADGGSPDRPATLDTDPATSWSTVAGVDHPVGPRTPAAANRTITVTGTVETDLRISLVARGPGSLRATVDGRALQFRCHEDLDDLLGCPSSGVLGTTVRVWGYGRPAQAYAELDALPGKQPGDRISVTVEPSGFAAADWRVSILLFRGGGALAPDRAWSVE